MYRQKLSRLAVGATRILPPSLIIVALHAFWPVLTIVYDLLSTTRSWWTHRSWRCPGSVADYIQTGFEAQVVPLRAQRPGILARLLHTVFKRLNLVFVVNMVPGTGHNTVELDGFLRMKAAGLLEPGKTWVLLRPPSQFHDATIALYGHHFGFTSNSRTLANLVAPVTAHCADIRLNVGLSRLRWQLRDDGTWEPPPPGQSFLHQVSKSENLANWQNYFNIRAQTRNLQPLADGLSLDPELRDFVGTDAPLALLHVKYYVANATARPTDPDTYLPTIRHLRDRGFRVVLFGREKMPPAFIAEGVLDYASSPLASYRHDLQLVAHAGLTITAGSGIALIPDCMNVPLVYLNSWHLGMPLASERCVIVPTLMTNRETGQTLSIAEQADLYWAMEDKGDEKFPAQIYEPRDASADEILHAVQEVLALQPDTPLTEGQEQYFWSALRGKHGWIGSRVSDYFMTKHADLLDTGEAGAKQISQR